MFGKYNRIDTAEKLQQLDSFLMKDDILQYPIISYDTETNGLFLYKTTVIGFSLSVDDKSGFYVPFLEWVPDLKSLKTRSVDKVKYDSYMDGHLRCIWTGLEYPEFVTPKEYKPPQFIVDYLSRWLATAKLIMHNAPFDVNHTFINTGVELSMNVLMDTALLAHIINENSPNALKSVAAEWKNELGINPHAMANQEQQELHTSIIRNGGKKKEIWRSDADVQCKYACADTFLTVGVFRVGMTKFIENFGEEKLPWLETEIMPLCREVVIPMKRRGVFLDIDYFKKLQKETRQKMYDLEDEIINIITPDLDGFDKGKTLDKAISTKRLVTKIIELENLSIPKKHDKKTDTYKETLAKGEVKKKYQKEPHWLWGYILGEDEIKYSEEKLRKIKEDLYFEIEGRRYQFNIQSDAHLRWLFCDKLGMAKSKLPQTESATKENPIPSMKAEVLREQMLPRHEWVHKLLVYKRLAKLHSTYIAPAVELSIDGWLYMDMRQNGTVSGRFACSGGFNLQTLPRVEELECSKCKSSNLEIKHTITLLMDVICKDCANIDKDVVSPSGVKQGFIAPPGYKIVNADYSSLEPRCFAYMSGDPKLIEVYDKGLDLYSKVYCDMFDEHNEYSPDPKADNYLKKKNPKARTMVKPLVLGIPYGARESQVCVLTNSYKPDGKLDYSRGKEIRDTFLDTYKELRNYMKTREIECIERGYVESIVGRRRHFVYAPYVSKFIINKHLKKNDQESINLRHSRIESFLTCQRSELSKGSEITVTNRNTGIIHAFTKDDLVAFAKHFRFDYAEKVAAKGYWAYVRALVTNEYNNAKNVPIQALAAHITNLGMLRTTRYFKQCGLDAWVVLQVHDEVTSYAKIEIAEDAAILMKSGMENNEYTRMVTSVKMTADPVICDNLKESK